MGGEEDDQKKKPKAPQGGAGPVFLAKGMLLLVSTQMVMLVYGKKVTDQKTLPLTLCFAQWFVAVVCSGIASIVLKGNSPGNLIMPKELTPMIVPLSVVWTGGFVLFNASASFMNPSIVSLVRCMEPLATVGVGYVLGERYSLQSLATLLPICGGVVIASLKGGKTSAIGIVLAMLSNLSFCGRPFFTQRLKRHPGAQLDSLGVFFNVSLVASVLLPAAVLGVEGAQLWSAVKAMLAEESLLRFVWNVGLSSLFFFFYQFTQLEMMSRMSSLEFSVLTPIIKAFMIVLTSIWWGDPFGPLNLVGVLISTGGGYLFTLAKDKEKAKKS